MLSDTAILGQMEAGNLQIDPFSEPQLKGGSYVLLLGRRFRRFLPGDMPVRMWSPNACADALGPVIEQDVLQLDPGEFVLASTTERIGLCSELAAQISPLSHVARFGLGVTRGADFINPGFGNTVPTQLTLELSNANVRPIEITAGMPVAHLSVFRLTGTSERAAWVSVYEGADPLSEPKFFEEWSGRLNIKK